LCSALCISSLDVEFRFRAVQILMYFICCHDGSMCMQEMVVARLLGRFYSC
jgi:hypothetical protein